MTLTFILLAYGITNIFVFGSIFESLRNFLSKINPGFLGKLVNCPMCFSTWVGFILSYILILTGNPTPITLAFNFEFTYLIIFLDGCFTSGCVWFLFSIEEFLTKEES